MLKKIRGTFTGLIDGGGLEAAGSTLLRSNGSAPGPFFWPARTQRSFSHPGSYCFTRQIPKWAAQVLAEDSGQTSAIRHEQLGAWLTAPNCFMVFGFTKITAGLRL